MSWVKFSRKLVQPKTPLIFLSFAALLLEAPLQIQEEDGVEEVESICLSKWLQVP